jgi:hypothetical protein
MATIRGRRKYRSFVSDADWILRIGVLADEVHKSTGVASIAYEAAHLFLCSTR